MEILQTLTSKMLKLIYKSRAEFLFRWSVIMFLIGGTLLELVQLGENALAQAPRQSVKNTDTHRDSRQLQDKLVAGIIAKHLFGETQASPSAAVIHDDMTSGPITLTGIIYTAASDQSIALISANNSERPYHIGDALPNGNILHEIAPSKVILMSNGNMYSLELHRSIDMSKPVVWKSWKNQGLASDAHGKTDVATPVSADGESVSAASIGTRVVVPPDYMQGKHIDPNHASRTRHTARFQKLFKRPPNKR